MTKSRTQELNYTDTLGFLGDIGAPMFDETTLRNVQDSGVGLIHMTTAWPFQDWDTTLANHLQTKASLQEHHTIFQVVNSSADLKQTRNQRKIGIIAGLQDPSFIGEDMDRVQQLYHEGVRILQVAYQQEGPYGSGFLVDAKDSGLTETGRRYIKAVNAAGIVLDLSHTAPKTALDALHCSSGPILISHTICRSIYNHPRGVTDLVLSEIAKRADVIVGVLAMTFFLDAVDNGLNPLILHIRHLADRLGPHRVAIGTDGPVGGFTDLKSAEKQFTETTQKLLDPRGEMKSRWPTHIPEVSNNPNGFEKIGRALAPHFSAEEIHGILGENARRFFERHLPQSQI
jgi:membrane dipeptidase